MDNSLRAKKDLYEIIKTNKRINIIGPPGCGKTTLCKIISNDTKIDLIELDAILFDKNCKILKNRNKILLDSLKSSNSCIIDGTYFSLMTKNRIQVTDHFIMIRVNFFRSLLGIAKRTYKNKACNCGEKLTFKLIKFLFSYYFYKASVLQKIIPNKKLTICKI